MKLRFLMITILLVLIFAGVSSVSTLATTGKPVEKEEFSMEFIEYPNLSEPKIIATLYKGAVKAAKWGAAAFAAGFTAAAGADAYSKTKGLYYNNKKVPTNAEVVFD